MADIWIAVTISVSLNLVIWLLTLRYWRRAEKKKKNDTPGTAEREARVFKLYQEIEGMLDSFEQYVSEVHEELERERAGLNESARQAQALLMQAMEKAAAMEKLTAQPPPPPAPTPAPPEKSPQTSKGKAPEGKPPQSRLTDRERQTLEKLESKSKRVRFLMSRGFAVDEVARELDIGIGEVRLIADLDKS